MPYKYFHFEKEDSYALITLDNPPGNTLNTAALKEFGDILNKLEKDEGVRAILMTGAGDQVFCSGIDLKELFANPPKTIVDKAKAAFLGISMVNAGMALFNRIEAYPKPIIMAINGVAVGGGLEMAMSAHIRLAEETVLMGLPEIRVGVIPGWGGSMRLLRLVGRTKALEMLLTGDPISAQEAERRGLINRAVPKEKLMTEAKALAKKLAEGPPLAMQAIIDEVRRGLDFPEAAALAMEKKDAMRVTGSKDASIGFKEASKNMEAIFKSEDARTGFLAFLTSLKPHFKGK